MAIEVMQRVWPVLAFFALVAGFGSLYSLAIFREHVIRPWNLARQVVMVRKAFVEQRRQMKEQKQKEMELKRELKVMGVDEDDED